MFLIHNFFSSFLISRSVCTSNIAQQLSKKRFFEYPEYVSTRKENRKVFFSFLCWLIFRLFFCTHERHQKSKKDDASERRTIYIRQKNRIFLFWGFLSLFRIFVPIRQSLSSFQFIYIFPKSSHNLTGKPSNKISSQKIFLFLIHSSSSEN